MLMESPWWDPLFNMSFNILSTSFCFPLLIKQDSGLVNMVVNPVDKTTTETDVFKYNKKKKLV